jgi:hypothetical protein
MDYLGKRSLSSSAHPLGRAGDSPTDAGSPLRPPVVILDHLLAFARDVRRFKSLVAE